MLKTLRDMELAGKSVIVRVDFNVPLDDAGNVTEDERIVAALPTINYLLEKNCKVILMSHLGRPKGKVVEGMRMDGVAEHLHELLGKEVIKLDDCVGNGVAAKVKSAGSGSVILLDNLRFHPEEEANDASFAKQLASLADIYVNDAFGASHRAHASVVAITEFLPSCAGMLMSKELEALGGLLESPEKPFIAILGGAKVSDKVQLIENLSKKVDKLLIGGAMMFTFLKAQGKGIGNSKVEADFAEKAAELMKGGKIVLPVDAVAADKFDASAASRVVDAGSIPDGWMGLDIGPKSVELFGREIGAAKTIVWNGPMGVFEFDNFASGTNAIAKKVAVSGATTIIGGGDTLAAAEKAGVAGMFTHTSTGGGAMLEFLEGKKLPAVAALEKSK